MSQTPADNRRPSSRTSARLLVAALFILIAGGLPAQDSTPAPAASDELTTASVRARIARVQEALAAADTGTTPTVEARARIEALTRLEGTLKSLDSAIEKRIAARAALAAAEQSLAPVIEGSGGPSFTFDDYLNALDFVDQLSREAETRRLASEKSRRDLEDVRRRLEKAEASWRQENEKLTTAKDDAARALLSRTLEEAELERRLARANAQLREEQDQTARAELDRQLKLTQRAETELTAMVERIRFGGKELQGKLIEIKERGDRLSDDLTDAQAGREVALRRLEEAQVAFDNAANDEAMDERRPKLDHMRRVVDSIDDRVDVLEDRIQLLATEEKIWRRLMPLLAEVDRAEWPVWREEAELFQRTAASTLKLLETHETDTRDRLLALRESLAEGQLTTQQKRWRGESETVLARHQEFLGSSILRLRRVGRVADAFLATIARQSDRVTLGDRILRIGRWVGETWNLELWHIGDSPITVKKVVCAVLILVIGFWVSRVFARVLRSRILPQIGVEASGAAALEKIINYGILLAILLLTLRVVNVPLTAFAFLGGAAAIAVGFGGQNILNNFISGIILLMERPVRIGDVIEIDSNIGVVEEIGGRSTRILTFDGTYTYLPNSYMLENKLVNLTVRSRMRCEIGVGVAYGSPTRRVSDLLFECVDRHGLTLGHPEPRVYFQDFGDNALNFSVVYWVALDGQSDWRIIRSDLRHMIAKSFAEAKIVIAFPQRDIHIDTLAPIEVRLKSEASETDAGTAGGKKSKPS